MANEKSNEAINREKETYYYVQGQRVPLVMESSVFAVKYKSGRNMRDTSFSPRARRLLDESENIGLIPKYDLKLYRAQVENISRHEEKSMQDKEILNEIFHLKKEEPVQFSSVAYRTYPKVEPKALEDLMFVTLEFAVQFKEEVTFEQILKMNSRYGVKIIKELGYVSNGYLLEAPSEERTDLSSVELANLYYETGQVIFANPNLIRTRYLRDSQTTSSTDLDLLAATTRAQFHPEQWHLNTSKVFDAWQISKGDPSIKVAILDDGVDIHHQEFSGKTVLQYDFDQDIAEGVPVFSSDNHGTACAGVAVAKGIKASGAAPECSLMAIRTPRYLGVVEEAEMFQWVCDNGADVISCSWGPPDDPSNSPFPLADNVRAAIAYCVREGRSGKGIPIFWAAGNGNQLVTPDGYAINPDVMAIAASNNHEQRSYYSDFGPEIFICAPSNGGSKSIFTIDRRADEGYNPNESPNPSNDKDYTGIFGGTSSATPLVAGVAALILSVKPSLKRDEVKEILKNSTDKIDQAGGNYDANGHSNLYGFGRLNALKALQLVSNGSGGPSSQLLIKGPTSIGRSDSPPTFEIGKGGRAFYAVELAADHILFHSSANEHLRNENNFYASWNTRLLAEVSFTPPVEAWDKLKDNDRIYYRLHVGDDNSWTNYAGTISSDQTASAPSIVITESGETPGSSEHSIQGPLQWDQNNGPPSFQIQKAGRRYYAVEVATEAKLFDSNNFSDLRNDHNFYGSWSDALLETIPYTLPIQVWDRLKQANTIYYRLHVGDDSNWSNHAMTISAETVDSAPSIQIGSHSASTPATITFPSGETFEVETNPIDGKDYHAPTGHGDIPLIKVAGSMDKRVSRNFKVKEFAASDRADYARISPQLVEKLQLARTLISRSITIEKGYTHPELNQHEGGNSDSLFLAGKAVEFRTSSSGITALKSLARKVLEAFDCRLGLGLGKRSLTVELRNYLTTWVESDARMSAQEFEEFVREECSSIESRKSRIDIEPTIIRQPYIIGPEDYSAREVPPIFKIYMGRNLYFGVEIASGPDLFLPDMVDQRKPENYFNSWNSDGFHACQYWSTHYHLPPEAWKNLRSSPRLFYRLVTSHQDTPDLEEAQFSTSDMDVYQAPYFNIFGNRVGRTKRLIEATDLDTFTQNLENLWLQNSPE